jgi:hypothetical protein
MNAVAELKKPGKSGSYFGIESRAPPFHDPLNKSQVCPKIFGRKEGRTLMTCVLYGLPKTSQGQGKVSFVDVNSLGLFLLKNDQPLFRDVFRVLGWLQSKPTLESH